MTSSTRLKTILSTLALAASLSLLPPLHAVTVPPFSQLVPADKHLDPAWVKSLTERGEPKVCTGAELNYIGMPIGGLFSGQLYLGGDGQLWNWDVFNDNVFTGWSGNYGPVKPNKPLEQAFSLTVDGREVPLDKTAFSGLKFRGEYPMAFVSYQDPQQPVEVHLTAFSPFIPLNEDDSSLPLTVLNYAVTNKTDHEVKVTLKGTLENFVLHHERAALNGLRTNKIVTDGPLTQLVETVTPGEARPAPEDQVLETWSKPDFSGWKVQGTAFGTGPVPQTLSKPDKLIDTQLGGRGDGLVTTVLTPVPGAATLTSAPFTITRRHLYFWMGPTGHHNYSGLDLLIDGKVVASVRPQPAKSDNLKLHLLAIDLVPYAGKQAVIRVVHEARDNQEGVSLGKIFQSDREILYSGQTGKIDPFDQAEDSGSMALALLDGPADSSSGNQQVPAVQKLVGSLSRTVTLKPGETQKISYVVAWYFPHFHHLKEVIPGQGRWYGSKFHSADDVVRYFAQQRDRLTEDTINWHDTWYNSTLPYWFLDRTMIPIDNLASSTNYRFPNGRWWAWEGVGACDGTCGHVYSYAQSVAALFPKIEREQREQIDFGTSQNPAGWIDCRGETRGGIAFDAQACYILRALREDRRSADPAFLNRLWPHVKLAMDWLIKWDGKESGILSGAQHNTLDADWYGQVSWLCGLYQAALRAAAEMATLQGDTAYAARCTRIADTGEAYLKTHLFNGEYYQNQLDPDHLESINSGYGSEIDQVSGQAWADLLDLPRVFPKAETMKALHSLWQYNYCPDAGAYRLAYQAGRRYADPGEAGVLVCTFPNANWDLARASGKGKGDKLFAGYFNETMTGFEHQLAGLMIREGMVTEGLSIERSIDDRYAPAKRNPYNEVECGDHYGRAMASYGVYLAACGFQYDGPAMKMSFAPRITPENFKCAFTAAEGWGTFNQKTSADTLTCQLEVNWGRLQLKKLALLPPLGNASQLAVTVTGTQTSAKLTDDPDGVAVEFAAPITLTKGQSLQLVLKKKE